MSLIHGADENSVLRPLLVDASGAVILAARDSGGVSRLVRVSSVGRLEVDVNTLPSVTVGAALPAGDNNIGNVDIVTAPTLTAQSTNADKLFSYSATLKEFISNTALAAGTNNLNGTVIAAGQVGVITNINIRYDGAVGGVNIFARLVLSGTAYTLYHLAPVVSGLYYDRQGFWPLAAGDRFQMTITGATLNDDAFVNYSGFLMTL